MNLRVLFFMCVCQCVALAGFAQGVEFRDISFAGALKAAKAENKTVFMDCYTSWCGPCKMMTNDIFPQEKVGKYMNENFVCVKYDMEKGEGVELKKRYEVSAYPTFLVIDADGTMVHRFVGYRTANDLLSELDYDPSSAWGAIQTRYDSGERDKEFLLQYLNLLMGASDKRAGKVAGELFGHEQCYI